MYQTTNQRNLPYTHLTVITHIHSCSLKDRDDKISEVYEEIEKDLHLVGATGIEDKLQVEEVLLLYFSIN